MAPWTYASGSFGKGLDLRAESLAALGFLLLRMDPQVGHFRSGHGFGEKCAIRPFAVLCGKSQRPIGGVRGDSWFVHATGVSAVAEPAVGARVSTIAARTGLSSCSGSK